MSNESSQAARRHAAGQDPAKRNQILDGARRCFLMEGFEAASMNDITAEAGVSKGTIYVYFENKEELFAELVDREREAIFASAREILEHATTVEGGLYAFGSHLTRQFTSDTVVKAQRMVLGVAERLPDLARRFFGPEPFSGVAVLIGFLQKHIQSGELAIDDVDLAARQFLDLAMASFFKRRLFGYMTEEPTDAELDRTVRSAVAMFLCYYGARAGSRP